MPATDFEFRHRFWLIAAVFAAGFASYNLDNTNLALTLARGSWAGVHVVMGVAALIVTAAAALRTWASAYLQIKVVKDTALHSDRLVADGPYRHLRNPLYLGTFLLALGFGLLASRLGFLVMAAGMAVVVWRLVGREEAELAHSQGAAFQAYRARVPAFWPSLRPRVPAGSLRPQWGQAWAGELMMWAFAVGTALFAATFDRRLFYAFLVLGFVGYLPGLVRTRSAGSAAS